MRVRYDGDVSAADETDDGGSPGNNAATHTASPGPVSTT